MERSKVSEIVAYLRANPDYVPIVRRALEYESEEEKKGYYLGFEWWNVGVKPSRLNKLVYDGLLKVSYKSRKSTCYKLIDRDAVEKALRILEAEKAMVPPPIEAELGPVEIPDDLFDFIVGYDDVKDIVKRSLRAEQPVHILFVGPPSSGKSLFLMELARIPGTRFALGGTTSKAGIADYLIEARPRHLIIDEIDKMGVDDQSVLLTVMETGIVTRLKHRKRETTRLRLWVFAGCNREDRLPPELLSRFLRIHFRKYTPDEFRKITVAVLTRRERTSKELAEYIARRLAGLTTDPRDAIKVARLAKTRDEVDAIVESVYRRRKR